MALLSLREESLLRDNFPYLFWTIILDTLLRNPHRVLRPSSRKFSYSMSICLISIHRAMTILIVRLTINMHDFLVITNDLRFDYANAPIPRIEGKQRQLRD